MRRGATFFFALFAAVVTASAESRKITASFVQMRGSAGLASGYLAKPSEGEHLPAVLLVPGQEGIGIGMGDSAQRAAREIAAAGFVALAVDYDPGHVMRQSELVRAVAEEQLSLRLNLAVDWLARQPFVDARRIGALGWAEGVAWVFKLAGQGKLQAGVVVGESLCSEPEKILQAGETPILVVVGAGASGCTPQKIAGLPYTVRSFDATLRSFPGSASANPEKQAVERAWAEVYQFLKRPVDNGSGSASEKASAGPPDPIASIRDIMIVINSDDGVKGKLAGLLAAPPANDEQWEQMRSQAAILAESGNWLLTRRPPQGSLAGWRNRATEFRTAAQILLRAVEQHDLPAAQEALRRLPESCAACHLNHR